MKSAILHLISLFLILGFVASCGKSGSGGSGGSNGNSSNTLVTSGSAAQTNLVAWYNSTVEGAVPNFASATVNPVYGRQVTKKTRAISTSNGCNSQPVTIFGLNLGNVNICSNSSGSNSYSYPVSGVTLISSGDKKTGNAELATALAPMITPGVDGLYLMSVTQNPSTQTSGSVFVLTYINSASKQVIQVIDTGFNSRLNPVYTADTVNGKETSVYSVFPALTM